MGTVSVQHNADIRFGVRIRDGIRVRVRQYKEAVIVVDFL